MEDNRCSISIHMRKDLSIESNIIMKLICFGSSISFALGNECKDRDLAMWYLKQFNSIIQ